MLTLTKGKLYGEQKERAENEPSALTIIEPACPPYFRDSEKKAWLDLSLILRNYNLFMDINAPFLELASIYMADVRNSYWEIVRKGKTIKGPLGMVYRNPAIKERDNSTKLLIKVLEELNISASGMAKLGAAVVRGKKREDDFFED